MKITTFFFFLLFFINIASAQTDCPIGMVNDPAPGSCGSFVDKDKNSLCDLSEIEIPKNKTADGATTKLNEEEFKQYSVSGIADIYGVSAVDYARELSAFLKITVNTSDSMATLHDKNALCSSVAAGIAANLKSGKDLADIDKRDLISGTELKQKTIAEAASIFGVDPTVFATELGKYYKIKINNDDSIQVLHDNFGLESSVIKDIAAKIPAIKKENAPAPESLLIETKKTIKPKYDFLIILFTLIIAYLITYILALKKTISFLTQQRIWNVVLALFFLVSGLSGIFLVLRINYGIMINWPFNMLWWHVEAGIAMAIISFFHLSWHWRYYACMLKRKTKKECDVEIEK